MLRHPFEGCADAVTEGVTAWRLADGCVIRRNQCDSDAFESHPLRQNKNPVESIGWIRTPVHGQAGSTNVQERVWPASAGPKGAGQGGRNPTLSATP